MALTFAKYDLLWFHPSREAAERFQPGVKRSEPPVPDKEVSSPEGAADCRADAGAPSGLDHFEFFTGGDASLAPGCVLSPLRGLER